MHRVDRPETIAGRRGGEPSWASAVRERWDAEERIGRGDEHGAQL
jgi:hypothetical protein